MALRPATLALITLSLCGCERGALPVGRLPATGKLAPLSCEGACSWCDPGTWGGKLPTAEDPVVIPDGVVVIECDVEAASVEVLSPATLMASRVVRSSLTVHGNVVVRGRLDYGTPTDRVSAGVTAELVFASLNDATHAGTPASMSTMSILDSDVGLWIVEDGSFTAAGQLERAWSKLVDGGGPGDADIAVEDATGWQAGDRVVLTPTAARGQSGALLEFEEATLAAVDNGVATLVETPMFEHLGCSGAGCVRRGEVGNLTRNVIVRSSDDSAHAHVMVAERGRLELDSVELRWLGPAQPCAGALPERRAPLYFFRQAADATGSFVRHVSIWGGQKHFLVAEASDGIEVSDVVGYDGFDHGFALRCPSCGDGASSASESIVLAEVLAAKIGVPEQVGSCARIQERMSAFLLGGGGQTGCSGCVATGTAYLGSGDDVSGLYWPDGGGALVLTGSVAHHNNGHGLLLSATGVSVPTPLSGNQLWSNAGSGVLWGGVDNDIELTSTTSIDNGGASVLLAAVPTVDRPRLSTAIIDDLLIGDHAVQNQTFPIRFVGLTLTGARPVGVTQPQDPCPGSSDDDAMCVRTWLDFAGVQAPSGMQPFRFGVPPNEESKWKVNGFVSADYPALTSFCLRRAPSTAMWSYFADFEGYMLAPCP